MGARGGNAWLRWIGIAIAVALVSRPLWRMLADVWQADIPTLFNSEPGALSEGRRRFGSATALALIIAALGWFAAGPLRSSRTWLAAALQRPAGPRAGILSGLALAAGFVLSITELHRFDLGGSGLSDSGAALVVAVIAKVALTGFWALCSVSLGNFALNRIGGASKPALQAPLRQTILSFFLGASLYGWLGAGLALVERLSVWSVLAMTLPALLFAPAAIFRILSSQTPTAKVEMPHRGSALVLFLQWLSLVLAAYLLLVRVVDPAPNDGDLWEHYLHYYSEVGATGSSIPSGVWYHFFLSKGAGLFLMSAATGGALTVPTVSYGFALATAAVVFDLLRVLTRRPAWAWFGCVLVLGLYATDQASGLFFKHHASFSGYAMFTLWAAALVLPRCSPRQAPAIATYVCLAYAGFHFLVPSALLLGALLGHAALLAAKRAPVAATVWAGVAVGAGAVFSLATNHAVTGLLNDVPIWLFWPIADQERFAARFGTSGLLFFLAERHGLGLFDGSVPFFEPAFRWAYLSSFFPGIVFALAMAGFVLNSLRRGRTHMAGALNPVMFAIFSLAAVTFAFAWFVRAPSTARLLVYAGILVLMVGVVATRAALSLLAGGRPGRLIAGAAIVIFGIRACVSAFFANPTFGSALSHAAGEKSVARMLVTAAKLSGNEEILHFLTSVRERIGGDAVVWAITHFPGPHYFSPLPGLRSEPSYSLGSRMDELVFGPADRAAEALKRQGITYLYLDLIPEIEGPLFSAIAFSSLFQPGELERHFTVSLREGNQFLLTWRISAADPPLPEELGRILELRRSGALSFTAESGFQSLVTSCLARLGGRRTGTDPSTSRCENASDAARDLARAVRDRMFAGVRVQANRDALEQIAAAIDTGLADDFLQYGSASVLDRQWLLERLSLRLSREAERRFGADLAKVLTRATDRIHFARMYASPERLHVLANSARRVMKRGVLPE
ncbi:MAG: hypothetical protein A3I00_07720 [Betaproteobacteria bacterium RIFCSPLOWO2_02_FULL_64_12]|nr:MAG: hypothetical protein A3I00_07720 [Betaproteobacteria bacterium RIFCSPLOWO2_02_FULL_64_12]